MIDQRPVLLVTGGSRGIGAAISRLAARQGWHVIVNFISGLDTASELVTAIRNEGGQATAIRADIGHEDEIVALFSEIDAKFGRLDGLVNNAGIIGEMARLDEIDRTRLERMFAINTIGALRVAGESVRRMSIRHGGKGGVIINISSMAAILGAPGQFVDYAASKAAIDTMTVGLAREVATEGIRVNGVRPGIIDTDLHASGGLPDRAQDLAPTIPMQRPGLAAEVADAVLYLLSPQASYVTGAILNVSGGR